MGRVDMVAMRARKHFPDLVEGEGERAGEVSGGGVAISRWLLGLWWCRPSYVLATPSSPTFRNDGLCIKAGDRIRTHRIASHGVAWLRCVGLFT